MAQSVKEIIKEKMQEQRLSASELERLAGLKVSAVKNILYGHTKEPKASTLQAIAEVLGCTVQDLMGKDTPEVLSTNTKKTPLQNPQLLFETSKILHQLIADENNNQNLTLEDALEFQKDNYLYSIENNSGKIDKGFSQWLFKKISPGN